MESVGSPARACHAVSLVLLLLLFTAGAAAAQVALSANGQQLNNLVGRGVALADFNGDGALDAFVVNQVTWESHDGRVYLGNGRGQFADSAQRLTGPGPADQPLVLDVDGNGSKDVLVGRVTWVNDGRGHFTAGPSVLDDTDGVPIRDARLADLNGDGAIDLLAPVMPGRSWAGGIRLYLNNGKGRFRAAGQTPLPGVTSAVGIGDLNGDGRPDVVVSGWRNEAKDDCPNRVLLNDGQGHFTDTGQQLDEELRHSHGLALGDLDGDRDLDAIVVTQGEPPAGHVYLNDGKGRFTSGPRIGTGSIENVALADFDGDGDLDVFLACIGPDEVWLNDGRGVFTDSRLRLGTAWSWQLAVGDVDGDRLPDVFVVNFTSDRTLPRDQSLVAHPAEVWLNTSRQARAPAAREAGSREELVGSPPQTTIHDAATRGDLQAVKAAIAADPAVVDAEKPPNKKTALHYAAQNGHADVVAFLLDKGADVNRPNIAGETPLHYAVGLRDPAVVNLLLARGANPNARTTNGATPLRTATAFARPGSIQALLDKGADARDTLPNGQTLLHMAAWVGPPEAIALLVSRGVDVNAAAKDGQTALFIACAAGHAAEAAALLDHKADPNTPDASGLRPLEAAVATGQAGLVKRLLEAGAKPAEAATADKRSALHVAAARGWLDITKMLLAAGADRTARDRQGRTPLDLAVRYGNERVADALRGTSVAAVPWSPARPAALERAPKMGEAVVCYLGHMGWAVRTANHFMVFDYDGRGVPPDEPSLANGSIDPNQIKDLPTTVFITHSHTDHYAPAVFDWKKTVKDITYVAGFKPEGKEGYAFMAPRETKTLGGLDITTTMANDEGVGYFVKVDGVTIFHSGDHSAGNGAPGSFEREIDFLAGRGLRADLLFMPISAVNDQVMNQGVHYAMKQLSAVAVFPGHVGGREDVYDEFARDAAKAGLTMPIHCPEFGGDHFAVAGRLRAQLKQADASEAHRDRTHQTDDALDGLGLRPGMILQSGWRCAAGASPL